MPQSRLCEVCQEKPPASICRDHDGVEHLVCAKCRPQVSVNAILAELAIQKDFLSDKLFQYLQYLKENPHSSNTYQVAQSFQADFETLQDRLSQIVLVKHYGREAKNSQGWIDTSFKPKTPKPQATRSDLKPKKTKPGTVSPKAKHKPKPKATTKPKKNNYQLPKKPKTWQQNKKKKKQ